MASDSDEFVRAVLAPADYVVVAALLIFSSGIGLYYRCTAKNQTTFKDYMLADRNMSVVPVAFSLMASFMSAITLMGVVEEMYMYGTQFIMINLSYIIATPFACYFFLPVFFRLQNTSVYEYLQLRFGYPTRLLASLAFSLQMIMYMGIVLYAPALALSAVTTLRQDVSIVVIGCVCTFYSALGGMKAVLLTDLLQSFLMFAAIVIVLVLGLQSFSVGQVFRIADDSGRLEFFNMSPDPRTRATFWTQVIGGVFVYLSLYGVNQTQVQRLLTIRSLRKSQMAVWLELPILMVLSLTTAFAGLIIYAQYKDCDPLEYGTIDSPDQLLPLYVVQYASGYPGLTGLFIAGIMSGSLSTVSSCVNSLAAVTISDYIEPVMRKVRPGNKNTVPANLSPVISVCFGAVCMGISFLTAALGSGVLQASLTVFGAVGGPLLGLFTLAMSTKMANQKGAMTGLIVGLIFSLWIGFGQPKPAPIYKPFSIEGCPNTTVIVNMTTTIPKYISENRQDFSGDLDPWNGVSYHASNDHIFIKEKSSVSNTNIEDSTFDDTISANSGSPFRMAPEETSTWSRTTTKRDDDDGFNFLLEMYAISYQWVALIGFLTTYLVGVAVSAVVNCYTGTRTEVNPLLLSTWFGGSAGEWSDQATSELESATGRDDTDLIENQRDSKEQHRVSFEENSCTKF